MRRKCEEDKEGKLLSTKRNKASQDLKKLSPAEKDAILEKLIQNPEEDASDLVNSKVSMIDPVTTEILKNYGSQAYRALHQLDRLRCSQQFEMAGRVSDDLHDLIVETRRYAPVGRFALLCRIAGVLSHAVEDIGEVFKQITCGGGGVQDELSEEMLSALNEMLIGNDNEMLNEAKGQLERVCNRLEGYCLADEMLNEAKGQLERVCNRLEGYCLADEFRNVLERLEAEFLNESDDGDSDQSNDEDE